MTAPVQLTRRTFGLVAVAASLAGAPNAFAETSTPEQGEIEVSGRKVRLFTWRAANTRAAVVFSHGAGADPRSYRPLFEVWTAAGISVVAPVYVDSEINPDRDKYTLASAFVPRWRDVTASVAYARASFLGVKIGAAGHSYGSMFSLMMAGALPAMFGPPKAPVDAVVAFSSPGKIGLVRPDSYAHVAAPMLQITGDRDLVEGSVSDWRDHLFAFETSAPGDKYAWVGAGVDHGFGGAIRARPSPAQDAAFTEAAALSTLFLRAYLLGEGDAKAALLSRADTRLGQLTRR